MTPTEWIEKNRLGMINWEALIIRIIP
jgi:hypothetical protein